MSRQYSSVVVSSESTVDSEVHLSMAYHERARDPFPFNSAYQKSKAELQLINLIYISDLGEIS